MPGLIPGRASGTGRLLDLGQALPAGRARLGADLPSESYAARLGDRGGRFATVRNPIATGGSYALLALAESDGHRRVPHSGTRRWLRTGPQPAKEGTTMIASPTASLACAPLDMSFDVDR